MVGISQQYVHDSQYPHHHHGQYLHHYPHYRTIFIGIMVNIPHHLTIFTQFICQPWINKPLDCLIGRVPFTLW